MGKSISMPFYHLDWPPTVPINGMDGRERPASFFWASDNDILTPSCVFCTRIHNNQPFQPFTMEKDPRNNSKVSPATTIP
jgi:hypothetical protein